MLEVLNRRLMDVKEKMRIKQKLLAALSDIDQRLSAQKSRLAELEKKLWKEGKDVKKLEGLSLSGIFYGILGSKEAIYLFLIKIWWLATLGIALCSLELASFFMFKRLRMFI
jgi:hypothetical protein